MAGADAGKGPYSGQPNPENGVTAILSRHQRIPARAFRQRAIRGRLEITITTVTDIRFSVTLARARNDDGPAGGHLRMRPAVPG
jgi:hypothetical protein